MANLPVAACDSPRPLAWRSRPPRGWRTVVAGLALAAALALCVTVIRRTDASLHESPAVAGDAAELIYVPPGPFLRAVSLNYQHVLADVLWFRAISYFGQHYRGDRVYQWLADLCNAVTDLDPQAQHVYLFAGVMLPWEADRIDDGIAMLEKGTRNIPDSWHLWYMLGFSYYFFKDDLAAASRALSTAVRLPDTPELVSRMLATLYAAHHGSEDALAFLTAMEGDDLNADMRSAIHERVLEMALTRDIDALEAAINTYESRFFSKPFSLTDLVSFGILARIPTEPFGGEYGLDPATGQVTSSTGHEPRRLRHSQVRDDVLAGKK
jgi:tetratricopeptide (TPR) repeat protein